MFFSQRTEANVLVAAGGVERRRMWQKRCGALMGGTGQCDREEGGGAGRGDEEEGGGGGVAGEEEEMAALARKEEEGVPPQPARKRRWPCWRGRRRKG
jgi:hypothetical protein